MIIWSCVWVCIQIYGTHSKKAALSILKGILLKRKQKQRKKAIDRLRKESQEKGVIRTYSYTNNTVVDNRSKKVSPLKPFLDGKVDFSKFSQE